MAFVRDAQGKRIVLASSSPRRRELMERFLGPNGFEAVPSRFAETLDKSGCTPQDYALANAREKGREVYRRLISESPSRALDVVIAADTVVVLNNEIFEKPRDSEDAFAMLRRLDGATHRVYTGVVFVRPDNVGGFTDFGHVEETEVEFRHCDDEVYRRYVETGEPLDKAGSYGYQGLGAYFIKRINGCYYNAVGLPAIAFVMLAQLLEPMQEH